MKVGDYVRTKYGIIAKINDIIEDLSIDCDIDVYYEDSLKDKMPMMEIPYNLKNEYIIKSSPNIIDLIEVGDYVNGHLVKNRRASCNENLGGHPKQVDIGENEDCIWISESKIKSIVTKEMYSSVEYKIGE